MRIARPGSVVGPQQVGVLTHKSQTNSNFNSAIHVRETNGMEQIGGNR